MAWVIESTKSSCSPDGKLATSSTNSSAQLVAGTHTLPDANKSATAFRRAILSLPLLGTYSWTGMPICRSSKTSGAPDALASTIRQSGSHSLKSSNAFCFSSGNSIRFLNALSKIILATSTPRSLGA